MTPTKKYEVRRFTFGPHEIHRSLVGSHDTKETKKYQPEVDTCFCVVAVLIDEHGNCKEIAWDMW